MNFLHSCGLALDQWIKTSKSHFFIVDASLSFVTKIKDMLDYSRGNIPFNYLGVPIFVGSPKARFFQPVTDKFRCKLISWKENLLA